MTSTPTGLVVGVDVSAVPADPRGAGRYVVELVRTLAARGNVELRLEARRHDEERWRRLAPAAALAAVVPGPRPLRLGWEQVIAPRFVDRWGIDVLHAPHYTMPEIARTPKVVTVHDLTFFDHPEWHERTKVSVFTRAIRVAARQAQGIVCVSDATARRLQELVRPSVPVHVVPHGIDHELFRPEAPDPADDVARRRALGIADDRPYVAFVGTLEPRKDLVTLVRAFDRLDADVQLVIAGGRGWGSERFERAYLSSARRDHIVRTGYVADEDVPAIFRGASAVVYPALAEGFGLPVIEALACGAPTITTAGSVMDELAGGAAFTAAAGDAASLAAAIGAVLVARHDRRALGLEVAARYTWDACAAGHEVVYEQTAHRR